MISGEPVYSETSVIFTPPSRSAFAVPPVERISMPNSPSRRANSTMPVLSKTLTRAVRIFMSGPHCTSAGSRSQRDWSSFAKSAEGMPSEALPKAGSPSEASAKEGLLARDQVGEHARGLQKFADARRGQLAVVVKQKPRADEIHRATD